MKQPHAGRVSSTTRRRVLVVEASGGWPPIVRDRLRSEGYAVEHAGDADQACSMAMCGSFDLIVLDARSPTTDRFRLCRDVGQRQVPTPILLLTELGNAADIITGLQMGAADYVSGPLDLRELMLRIEVLLGRRGSRPVPSHSGFYEFGSVRVDVLAAEATREGNAVTLLAREFHLLRYFLEHPRVTFSRGDLLSAVWGRSPRQPTRTVDIHIACLRRKLECQPRQPEHFLTVHRLGYKFKP